MHRFKILIFAAMLLTAAAGAWAMQEQAEPQPQPWGTWMWWLHLPGGRTMPTIVTLHKEGTANSTPGTLFGAQYLFSPLHDVWEKTGPNHAKTTCLQFIYDAASRTLLGFGRTRIDVNMDDFDHLSGTMYYEFLPCPTPVSCPDPTDPGAVWQPWTTFPATGRPFTATRLKRVEPGPLP